MFNVYEMITCYNIYKSGSGNNVCYILMTFISRVERCAMAWKWTVDEQTVLRTAITTSLICMYIGIRKCLVKKRHFLYPVNLDRINGNDRLGFNVTDLIRIQMYLGRTCSIRIQLVNYRSSSKIQYFAQGYTRLDWFIRVNCCDCCR